MRLNEITFTDGVPVDGYGPGFFRVSGQIVHGGICILPSGVSVWSGFDDLQTILKSAAEIDVLFAGTGTEIAHIPPDVRATIEDAGPGVEVMASPAACRTYNVLLSEGRRVGLVALPV